MHYVRKGIENGIIDEVIEWYEDEINYAMKEWIKEIKEKIANTKEKNVIIQSLTRKGYPYDLIKEVFDE